jgi:hypothetical protein
VARAALVPAVLVTVQVLRERLTSARATAAVLDNDFNKEWPHAQPDSVDVGEQVLQFAFNSQAFQDRTSSHQAALISNKFNGLDLLKCAAALTHSQRTAPASRLRAPAPRTACCARHTAEARNCCADAGLTSRASAPS